MSNPENGIPIISLTRTPVQQSHQLHPYLQKDHSTRIDRRGERPQSDALTILPAYGAPSRGPVERRVISREEANEAIARQAAQVGAQQALDVGALQSQVAAQAAVIARQDERLQRQDAQIEALQSRLDALEGGAGEAV
jgi:hypothetical protein